MALSGGGDPGAYVPPLSLWNLVEQHVSPEEQDEIKSMLGTSLVENTLDLHKEVQMLLEIWQDYQEEATEERERLSYLPQLAEPPHQRERLVQEICFLAESVREKSASKGVNPSEVFSRHSSQVLEYAEGSMRCGSSLGSSRPQSACSSDGRQTPRVTSDHANSRFALDSAIKEEVFSANDKLNYLQFDAVCNRLRETLTQEMEQLENDVTFLQCCLTDAVDNPAGHAASPALSREPTLTDLKEERTLLEKELLSTESLPNTPTVHRPHFQPAAYAQTISTKPALGPVSSAKLRPVQTTTASASAAVSSSPAPLKALHHPHAAPTPSPPAQSQNASGGPVKEESSSNVAGSVVVSTPPRILSKQSISGPGGGKGYPAPPPPGKSAHTGKREGSAVSAHSRLHSASSRVKVVPVGRVHQPRADSATSRSFITPTPPPPPVEGESHTPRPGSAQRFRSMVMSCRETT